MIDVTTILAGLGAGITYGLTAYFKKKEQKFDWAKLGTTTIIGAGAGILMAVMDMPIEGAHEFVIGLGVVPIVENILKIIWRKIFGL